MFSYFCCSATVVQLFVCPQVLVILQAIMEKLSPRDLTKNLLNNQVQMGC